MCPAHNLDYCHLEPLKSLWKHLLTSPPSRLTSVCRRRWISLADVSVRVWDNGARAVRMVRLICPYLHFYWNLWLLKLLLEYPRKGNEILGSIFLHFYDNSSDSIVFLYFSFSSDCFFKAWLIFLSLQAQKPQIHAVQLLDCRHCSP